MKKIILFSFLFLSLSTSLVYSQPQFEWVRNYHMQGKAAAMDSSGNVYIVGTIGNTTKLLKYNSSGNLIWQRYDSIRTSGMGICAAADKHGNVYFTAEDFLFRIATISYDSSGNRNWVRYYYDTLSTARAQAMAVDNAGNIYVAGYGRITARYNYLTIKYNPQGDTLWTAVYYNNYGGSSVNAICTDLQNNVYVTGWSLVSTPGGDYLTIKYNSNGIQQWLNMYDGPNHLGGDGESITVDKLGNSYVTGSIQYDINRTIIATIKYAPNGDSLWTRLFFPPFPHVFEYGNNLLLDSSLNLYVSGKGSDSTRPGGFLRTIKYDKYGNLVWTTSDTGANIPYSSTLDKYSNIYSTGATGHRFYNTEYNSFGNKIWSSYYPENNPPFGSWAGFKILLDNYDNLYIIGSSLDSSLIIKYGLLTNINKTSEIIDESYLLFQNYPNPFNPETKIRFNIPPLNPPLVKVGSGMVTLKIYDVTGKEITTLVNEQLQPGSYEITFDGSNLASGIYFYQLTTGEFIQTRKMILLK